MGWFWSSTSSAAAPSQAGKTPSSPSPSSASSQSIPPTIPQEQSPSNRDNDGQGADAELNKFMAMLQGNSSSASSDDKAKAKEASTAAAPSKLAAWKLTSLWPGSSSADAATAAAATTAAPQDTYVARERSLAEAVLPVQMSCRQAFDMAWACQSPAGQWRAVYRHGGVRPCSELWDDFWFCMRVKGYGEGPLKEEAIREHYRKKEMDKYYKPDTPSSEDVWQSRTVDEVLAPDTVFHNSFQAVLKKRADGPAAEMTTETTATTSATSATSENVDDGREDANQILADAERRRRIRQQMGYT